MNRKRPILLIFLFAAITLVNASCGGKKDNDGSKKHPTNSDVTQVDPKCGNKVLDDGEKCDLGIDAGKPGACETFTSCTSKTPADACNKFELQGTGCQQKCVEVPKITACANGDGCCPPGCTDANDDSCSPAGNPNKCGNKTLDPGELCDTKIASGTAGACPTAAECAAQIPTSACKKVVLSGTDCSQECVEVDKTTTCTDGDGCCAAGCTNANDSDCPATPPPPLCGNNTRDPGERCDTMIPHGQLGSCKTAADCAAMAPPTDACKKIVHTGTDCDQACTIVDKTTSCTDGDGCCPSSCTPSNDSDCHATPVELGADCDAFHICKGGATCTKFPNQSKGICTIDCTDPSVTCPTGSLCDAVDANRKYCLVDCSADSDLCASQTGAQCHYKARHLHVSGGNRVCYATRVVDSSVGESCTDGVNCGFDGICEKEDAKGFFKGGECTALCNRDTCPTGSKCMLGKRTELTGNFCYKECDPATPTSCRDGYFCAPSTKVCLPLPPGTHVCQDDTECTAPQTCADPLNLGYKTCQNVGGVGIAQDCTTPTDCQGTNPLCEVYDSERNLSYCTLDCEYNKRCPDDSICITFQLSNGDKKSRCLPDCRSTTATCDTSRSFVCKTPAGIRTYCDYEQPTAKIPKFGEACANDTECGANNVCLDIPPNFTGGYCSANCALFQCPSNGHCLRVSQNGSYIYRCAKDCNFDTDCGRADYECRHSYSIGYCVHK